jgi:hypothetical protein
MTNVIATRKSSAISLPAHLVWQTGASPGFERFAASLSKHIGTAQIAAATSKQTIAIDRIAATAAKQAGFDRVAGAAAKNAVTDHLAATMNEQVKTLAVANKAVTKNTQTVAETAIPAMERLPARLGKQVGINRIFASVSPTEWLTVRLDKQTMGSVRAAATATEWVTNFDPIASVGKSSPAGQFLTDIKRTPRFIEAASEQIARIGWATGDLVAPTMEIVRSSHCVRAMAADWLSVVGVTTNLNPAFGSPQLSQIAAAVADQMTRTNQSSSIKAAELMTGIGQPLRGPYASRMLEQFTQNIVPRSLPRIFSDAQPILKSSECTIEAVDSNAQFGTVPEPRETRPVPPSTYSHGAVISAPLVSTAVVAAAISLSVAAWLLFPEAVIFALSPLEIVGFWIQVYSFVEKRMRNG